MADVKVPPLLHKMSLASQKAWYKKHGMEMPSAPAAGGKSAAQAKKDVGEINKQKAKEKSALQKALETSPKQKELKKSSARVQQMAANALAFGGQRPGGDLTTARGIVSYIRGGGYLKAGRLGEETVEEAVVKTKEVNKQKLKNYVRGLGTKAVIAGKVPFDQVHSPLRAGRKVLKQEEVEHIDEVTKKEAEAVIGGPVKEKPKMAPGKQPAGYRYVRGLARKAMKAGLKKEEVEQVVEQDDTMEKKEMAETQLHFIKYAAEEILEFIKMGGEIEEWYQNKLSKVQSEVESLHSYIEGEKRRTGMVEETEEQIEEKYMGFKKLKASIAAKGGARSPAAVAASIGRKKYGKEKFQAAAAAGKKLGEEVEQIDEQSPAEIKAKYYHDQFDKVKPVKAYDKEGKLVGRYRSMDHAKQMKPGHTYKVEEEVVTEAEGKVAVTPKEKELAAHHGDPKKITYGDVIKARLKSVAAKKMGKQ